MFIVGGALAAVALTGGWTLAGKLFSDVEPSMVTASIAPDAGVSTSSFAERFGQRVARAEQNADFTDRFEPARRAPLAGSAPVAAPQAKQQVAWFAPSSMGAPPDRFAQRWSAVEPTVPAPAKPQEVALMQPAPTVKQLVASIPTPNARPTDAGASQTHQQTAQAATPKGGAFGHDALVQRARMALATQPKNASLNIFDKLFGGKSPQSGPVLAYAGSDGGVLPNGQDATSASPEPTDMDRLTAVYDITAKRVYMPDGTKLEAHSGLGSRMDNPAYAHERMRGVTPPHIYDLKPREALFHGVAALRMTPLGGESAIYGRNGLLTHSYLLGPNGDSNGCISFKEYDKFLQAYRRGEVRRVVVVASLD
ncbi:DUF2778 domain-containing protein [Tardiphaga alba]|uniref:DUF2778 domain-containing protein n=1 Tax=Tardiphaga alba TaxID=340268 RepID=A0ABX8AG34_9BRAD|nr:DUF2778 domain-containing protein [Tardiphaga alba]QUS40760.1 DUF2778 domain-containing protein [Tardiphaga alba]